MASISPWSSGVSASSPRYCSTSSRCSSGVLTLGLPTGVGEGLLDLLGQLGQLLEHLERLLRVLFLLGQPLQLGPCLLQAGEQLFGAPQRILRLTHAARSRMIRPR